MWRQIPKSIYTHWAKTLKTHKNTQDMTPNTTTQNGDTIVILERKNTNQKVINNVEDIVIYTDLDTKDPFPIYIKNNNEISIKKKPEGSIKAVVYVKSVEFINDEISHPLLERARDAMKDVMGEVRWTTTYKIVYEVYRGDMEELIGEATAYAIKLRTPSKFSGEKYAAKRAFATAYDAQRRIISKYREIAKYVYVKGDVGRKERAYVNVIIKLPIISPELEKMLSNIINNGITVEKQNIDNVIHQSDTNSNTNIQVNTNNIDSVIQMIQKMIHTIQQIESQLTLVKSELEKLLTQLNTQS